MPDRYGETGDAGTESDRDRRIRDHQIAVARAIAACDLCDDDGYIGATVCDHIDHRQAAKRGRSKVDEAMGWNR